MKPTTEEREKSCRDCQCRDCSPITAMAERLDAYHAAKNLLRDVYKEFPRPEDDPLDAREVLVLANWLYFGGQGDGD